MEALIKVTVTDANGKTFSRDWAASANRIDAIRWTTTNEDLPHIIDADSIQSVNITEFTQ